MSPSPPERVRLYVPWLTILKILSAAVLVWIWLQLWPIGLVVLVALVLAVTLEPVVRWLERRTLKRGLAVLLVGAVTLATIGVFLAAAVAPLTEQTTLLVGRVASFQEALAERLPPTVARVVRRGSQDPTQMMAAIAARVPQIVSALLTAGETTLFAFVLTLYLLADGRRTYAIAPKVYGHQLELSGIAVLLALVTGAAIGGIIGALPQSRAPFASGYPSPVGAPAPPSRIYMGTLETLHRPRACDTMQRPASLPASTVGMRITS